MDLRDITSAGLLAEVEHWRLLFAEIDSDPDTAFGPESRAYCTTRLRSLNNEVARRKRLSHHPVAPPWPTHESNDAERDEARLRLELVATIRAHVPFAIERRGRSYWLCCPLPGHDDTTPSFEINPDKQLWHCFGCQRGGDVFEFIRHLLSVDGFPHVMQIARVWAGMPEPVTPRPTRPNRVPVRLQ